MRPLARPALLLAALLAACGTAPSPTSGPSVPASLALREVAAEPVAREAAAIGLAFDATAAEELVEAVPAGLDFADTALLCVFLGERPTDGWGLDLSAAALVDGELRITARETRPRGSAEEVLTYPADCATLDRAALPVGELAVRADDTISDEFIVGGSVAVPPAPTAP
jgi:hypothetical protein